MTIEQNATRFAAWLDDRADDQAERLRFTRTNERARLLLKTEAAELEAVRDAFYRLILAEMSPTQQAFFLARRNAKREGDAIKL